MSLTMSDPFVSHDDPTKMTRFVLVLLDGMNTLLVSTKNSKGVKVGMISTGISGIKASSYEELVHQLPDYIGAVYRVAEEITTVKDVARFEKIGVISSETGEGGGMVFILVKVPVDELTKITAQQPTRRAIMIKSLGEVLDMYRREDEKLRKRGYTTYFHADLLNFGRIMREFDAYESPDTCSKRNSIQRIMYKSINNTARSITIDRACSTILDEVL